MRERQLLIVGAPRSGTTLLATIVGRHPDIALLNEDKSGAWQRVLGKSWVGVKLCCPNQIELSRNSAQRSRKELLSEIAETLSRFSAWDRGYKEAHFERLSPLTLEAFANARSNEVERRVLAIARRPDAVVRSIQERGGQPLSEALYRWLRAIEILHSLNDALGERCLTITFENLVAQPDAVAQRLSSWLGLGFHEAMVDGYTPLYKMEMIDAGKAERADSTFDAQMAASFPKHHSFYQMICAKGRLASSPDYDSVRKSE